ncbi:RNA polymerase sigma-70 factor, ECF subfamily [Beijerinckia sp. 28-YEA-48]|nr:RNA polymerase sigma-70 factor, ECF subfamily [Beijerinckia sp. 28-YEA-48]
MTHESRSRLFNEVVMPHLDDAFVFARWLTGNPTDAEDVVQEACLRAFNGVEHFSGGNARAWLFSIVRNTTFTWLARNRPKTLVLSDDLEALERTTAAAPETATPEAEMIARADEALLQAAIADLPTPFREALVLREFNGLSYREIADIIDIPVGTVMSRLARARTWLIARIGKDLS